MFRRKTDLPSIDVSRLSHWPDVWESFKAIPETSFDGQTFFMPWDTGNVSIVYRADLVDLFERKHAALA